MGGGESGFYAAYSPPHAPVCRRLPPHTAAPTQPAATADNRCSTVAQPLTNDPTPPDPTPPSPGMPPDAFASPGAEQELVECGTCGRRMNPRALQAHAKACGAPKRKKFDSTKARVKGTEVHTRPTANG